MTQVKERKLKNAITIAQLELACRHVHEMMATGVTENLSIRTLELFADVYAKMHMGGSPTPHHVNQVEQKYWSREAKKAKKLNPKAKAGTLFRVEHGTPRREFARKVLELYKKKKLTEMGMKRLVRRYWKLAVITLEEDIRLNKIARSKAFSTPEKRWKMAGIKF